MRLITATIKEAPDSPEIKLELIESKGGEWRWHEIATGNETTEYGETIGEALHAALMAWGLWSIRIETTNSKKEKRESSINESQEKGD